MVKVLMLTANSSLMDGINRHILTICPALNRMDGLEVAVCTVMPAGELNASLETRGIKTFSLNAGHGHDMKIAGRYMSVMKSFQPDIVHIHVMAMMERIVASLCFRKVKYIKTIHGIRDKVEHPTVRMRLEEMLNKIFPVKLSARCYISEGVREALAGAETDQTESYVVYNPISFTDNKQLDTGQDLSRLIGVKDGTPIIGTSCRIANVKNPEAFTEVMCMVLKSLPDTHAVVMGDGSEAIKTRCRAIVEQYGVETRFHWLGYRSDAPHLVQGLSCFIMTSHSEGLPTSLLECMSLKTPIAFMEGNGGLKDIARINAEEGPVAVTASAGDLKGMVAGIISLLNEPAIAEKYAERAYAAGIRHFDIDAVAMMLNELYKSKLS